MTAEAEAKDMQVCITIDMEHDCPPFRTTYKGVEDGTPQLLKLFKDEGIPATFFTTGDVARRYPQTVDAIVEGGHELGCHGDTHKRFGSMEPAEAREELRNASKTLRKHANVVSFRAPNLDFPDEYVPFLADEGYQVDSSRGRHKQGSYFAKPVVEGGMRRIPASIMPSVLRAPGPIRNALCRMLESPAVLFFHPWEFIDMTREKLRFDIKVRTGEPALRSLRDTIRYYKRRNASFLRISEVPVS